MTPGDQKIMFNAFAFLAFILKGDDNASSEKIAKLAAQFERFCLDNVEPGIDEMGAALQELQKPHENALS